MPLLNSTIPGAEPTTAAFKAAEERRTLKDFLAGQSSHTIMRHCVGLIPCGKAPPLLQHTIVVAIACESFEVSPSPLTEIGIATFKCSQMAAVGNQGHLAENLLKQAKYYHYRLKEVAHLVNTKYCPGKPWLNRFGITHFVNLGEAKQALRDVFQVPINPNNPRGPVCPVIFLGHAIKNDIRMLSKFLGEEDGTSSIFDSMVAVIDTQIIARELGLERQQIGLQRLCEMHGFEFRNGHTAGNDTAYTLISAVWMAMRKELGFDNGQFRSVPKTPEQVVEAVSRSSRVQGGQRCRGTATFCEHCESVVHRTRACRMRVNGDYCAKAGKKAASLTHTTHRCKNAFIANSCAARSPYS
ncbi:hypothetical protein M011DRAFT_529603 [Sporormia fimetaria CBS 119925]|uniref:Gfd2/YDR514C-like C-terminal domain-containing protein n=1 Tax=Sporormia fimetaria CBS 119925 TaxID=1340428 RepID=A0A6A6UZ07_9PLEO|nr:hypothetical protein M011DRAFT_529603 [Sporormia fimetaria CBS 119925]